jgi:hypothetical protein
MPPHRCRWPSPDTGSRLVFITRNIEEPTLRALFQAVSLMQAGSLSRRGQLLSRPAKRCFSGRERETGFFW